MHENRKYPVLIIGGGPVGLAAAANCVERGLKAVVLEQGATVGTSLRAWGHVRVFSPWQYTIDAASRRLLLDAGWTEPDPDALPTGAEIVERYLEPLAGVPGLVGNIRFNATVTAISRLGLDKVSITGREAAPFVVRYRDADGQEGQIVASAVLDASGTWNTPNPIGIDGLPVPGEEAASDRIAYGIPDVTGRDKALYAGRHVLVIGSGHSAINNVLALLELQKTAPDTMVSWGLRRNRIEKLLGGGLNDQLPARGALGIAAKAAIAEARLRLLSPFSVLSIAVNGDTLTLGVRQDGKTNSMQVDRIVVATGFRPDLQMLRELRLDLDAAVEAPRQLAPMIDPNLHSCGTVPPHGVVELSQPEPGFYIIGSKSYGRAPTFLMATGYEQARSVIADLAGDHVAAREVHLVLPETGVCNSDSIDGGVNVGASGCCGGPAPAEVDACCVADATAKSAGRADCGCGPAKADRKLEPAE